MDKSSSGVETGVVAGGVEPRLGGACRAWDNVGDDVDSTRVMEFARALGCECGEISVDRFGG